MQSKTKRYKGTFFLVIYIYNYLNNYSGFIETHFR